MFGPSVRYRLKLLAVNSAGASSWSQECGFHTAAAPPAAPPFMVVTLASANSVLLAW